MDPQINEEVRKAVRRFFRQMNFLFSVFVAGLILFLVTAYIVVYYRGPAGTEYGTMLFIASPVSGIALIVMAYRLYLGRLKGARESDQLYVKMESYRSGQVLRMILFDGAAFVQLIVYLLTGEKLYLLLCLGILTVFFLARPNLERFITDLQLNDTEARVMRDHAKPPSQSSEPSA